MTEEQQMDAQKYADGPGRLQMLREFFDQVFFEFQMQSRKKPNSVVNAYKVERLNRILRPLLERMKGEDYAAFLEEIPMPEEQEDEDGKKSLKGLTYSDVALMMAQFKSAVNRMTRKR